MNFNKKFLDKNIIFIIYMILFIIIFVLINMIITSNYNNRLEEKDLPKNFEGKYSGVVINEIMPSNKNSVMDKDGNIFDWIEIYNANDYEVNLKSYGLSDRTNKTKWAFNDTIIGPKSYIVVYLSGEERNGLYANFKLSSDGTEQIYLTNSQNKVIDAANINKVNSNEVLARDSNGNWYTTKKSTPGFENTEEGHSKYIESLIDFGVLKINEILPKNNGNFKNSDNNYSGYIEVINSSDKNINLSNYYVSDSEQSLYKFNFPNINLKPNEVFVIYTNNYQNTESEIYSGFSLSAKNGKIYLSNNKGKIIDIVEYNDIPNGMAYVRNNENMNISGNISPGFPNNYEGSKKFSETKQLMENDLIISEIMNSNYSYMPQNGDEYYDWIELKNNSNKNINLKDYYLTNNKDVLNKFALPDKKLKPGEYYILMASGDTNLSNNSYIHINFKISDIDSIYLVKNKRVIDSIFIYDIPTGYSMGKKSNGIFYFETPTPLLDNGDGVRYVSDEPSFSEISGIYNNVDKVEVKINGNGTIYYTLDGSIPTTSSKKYSGSIFLNKTTTLKAIAYEDGKIKSNVVVGTYIINENHKLPVMSVSLNPSDFKKFEYNIWSEDEVSAYAELYENGKSFFIPCGFKLFGGTTRMIDKKSFSLKFKKKYGASSLNYQVFENRDYSKYDSLVLRSGSQDSELAFIRDALMTSLVDGVTNLDVQAYKFVVLYINGNYWGIYKLQEKIDENFISSLYSVDSSDVNIVRIDGELTAGNKNKYNDLINYLKNNDVSTAKSYEHIKSQLNVESYADFWVAQNWTANVDTINTRFFWHPKIDNGRINMIFYDLDYGMRNAYQNYFDFSINQNSMTFLEISTFLLRTLMKNSEFREIFLDRLAFQVNNVWNEDRVINKIDEMYNELKSEMDRNQRRWGMTFENWNYNIEQLKSFARNRRNVIVSNAKYYFGLDNEAVKKYFGG